MLVKATAYMLAGSALAIAASSNSLLLQIAAFIGLFVLIVAYVFSMRVQAAS